ncbi:MAG: hypothetical protein MJ010_04225 [Paludibacteraceae bacterium]|nr:hypothetical protein [Paludibacteraceae bacterium]
MYQIKIIWKDDVKALGLDSKKLRLYCLLVSEQIVILGNGGVKDTRTYQEDETLNGYVLDLKQFNRLLKAAQKSGKVTIEGNVIKSVEFETITLPATEMWWGVIANYKNNYYLCGAF